jgi:hypothetical protein
MTTRSQFRQKWHALQEEYSRRDASMPAGPLLAEILNDLDAVERAEGDELLNLTQAGIRSGYAPDSLRRLIHEGKLENLGRKNAPRLRARDLPRKPLRLPAPRLQVADASRQKARVSTTTPRGGR